MKSTSDGDEKSIICCRGSKAIKIPAAYGIRFGRCLLEGAARLVSQQRQRWDYLMSMVRIKGKL